MWQALALARDEQSNNDDMISAIVSDSRLKFAFLAGMPLSLSSSPSPKSVRQAVARLGHRKCLSLLWLIAFSDFLSTWPQLEKEIRGRLWTHSLLTGLLADQLASAAGIESMGNALAAGLAHDIGHLLVSSPVPRLGILRDEEPDQLVEAALSPAPERDHCRLGAALLTLWDAPAEVVASALHHHDPNLAVPQVRPLVVGVRLADLMVEHLDLRGSGPALELDTAPAWRQLVASAPWNRFPRLHRFAVERLPETILLARHVARLFG
jgi:HD-like signal output (HDOD) protein